MKLVAHTLHLDDQLDEFVTDVLNRLLVLKPHPFIEPGNVVVPTLNHLLELTAGSSQGKTVAESAGANFFWRHRCARLFQLQPNTLRRPFALVRLKYRISAGAPSSVPTRSMLS